MIICTENGNNNISIVDNKDMLSIYSWIDYKHFLKTSCGYPKDREQRLGFSGLRRYMNILDQYNEHEKYQILEWISSLDT